MVTKVDKIKEKVYDEILETEMALTRLEVEPLESIIPEDIKIKSNKALLQKMNTLKQRLLAKNPFGSSDEESFDEDDSSNELNQSQDGDNLS